MKTTIRLLKFSSDWCQPCRAMKPVVAKFIEAHPEVTLEEVDIEKEEKKAKRYDVEAIPTIIFVDAKGEPLTKRQVGLCTSRALENRLAEAKGEEKHGQGA